MPHIGIWELLLILVIVLLLFGAKKLRNIGNDLGSAVKGFRSAMRDGEEEVKDKEKERLQHASARVIDGEVSKTKEKA